LSEKMINGNKEMPLYPFGNKYLKTSTIISTKLLNL